MQGTIKKIEVEKKSGFIGQEGVEKDVIFSSEKLDGVNFEDLKEGDAVTFEVEEGDNGQAINVKKV
ncbi:MAG: cold shock domain-containing protein [Patescibacteria group bacterium]